MRPISMPGFRALSVPRDAVSRPWKCPGHAPAAASRRCSKRSSWSWLARCRWRSLPPWWASTIPASGAYSTIMSKKPAGRLISLKCVVLAWMKRPAAGDTSCRYWRNYISLLFDLHVKRLLYGAEGRDQDTVCAFAADLSAHGCDPDQVRQVCCDMWPAYIKGVQASFPNAEITFDRFPIQDA